MMLHCPFYEDVLEKISVEIAGYYWCVSLFLNTHNTKVIFTGVRPGLPYLILFILCLLQNFVRASLLFLYGDRKFNSCLTYYRLMPLHRTVIVCIIFLYVQLIPFAFTGKTSQISNIISFQSVEAAMHTVKKIF